MSGTEFLELNEWPEFCQFLKFFEFEFRSIPKIKVQTK